MTKPIIVNVAGKARHGKDTFASYMADHIYEEYGLKVQIIHYADAVKEKARELGWDGEKDQNGRTLLQFIGQFYRDYVDKDYWILKAYDKIHDNTDVIIFADTRYINEITHWIMNGYRVTPVNVVRLDAEGNMYDNGLDDKLKNHKSETSIDNYPFYHTVRHETLDHLKNQAEIITNGLVQDV